MKLTISILMALALYGCDNKDYEPREPVFVVKEFNLDDGTKCYKIYESGISGAGITCNFNK